jgi:tryptophanyl-tRNA synthetase
MLSGDRPTGRLHLGHLVGSLRGRVAMQEDHDCFVLIADLHSLTTRRDRAEIAQLPELIRQLVLDYLAVGIDPRRSTIYLQSAVPQTSELFTLLAALVPLSRLERLPSLKEMAAHARLSEQPLLLTGYPVLQAADILLPRADVVPVGADNLAHVEITRELARRFNHLYGETFTEPAARVGLEGALVGTDNRCKMSKSAGNAIFLSDDADTVARKVRRMYTDPARIHASIPGTVAGNPVFIYLDLFCPDRALVASLKARYEAGAVGDGEVKGHLTDALEATLAPIRARRAVLEAERGLVESIVLSGSERMADVAADTMSRVRRAMGLDRTLRRFRRAVR